jgi:type II secretory pathway component GspD/PulD (secretin)
VAIKAHFMEVNTDFMKELGIKFQAGMTLAHLTNTPKENRIPEPGFQVGASVEAEPLEGLYIAPGLSFFQDGQRYKNGDFLNSGTRNNIGLQLSVIPHITPTDGVELGIVVEPSFSYLMSEIQRYKDPMVNDRVKIELTDNVNRFAVQARTGVSATVHTDRGDLAIAGLYSFGLTNVEKDTDIKSQFFSLSVIAKLFFRKEVAEERPNLIIFVKPELIQDKEK